MAATAEELIVALRSEGAEQAQQDLESVEEQTGEVSNQMGETSDQMQDLRGTFQGALGALVAGVAIAAAGLASQIPIVGELLAGFGAIIDALALQIDQLARDLGAGGLTGALFNIAGAINEQEGIWGDLIGAVTAFLGVAATVTLAVAKIGAFFGAWASTSAGVVSILGTVVSVVGSVAAAIISLPGAIAVAIAGIIAFVAAYLTNWRGTRDKTDKIVGEIWSLVKTGFTKLKNTALDLVDTLTTKATDRFNDLLDTLKSWASDLADKAMSWGKNLIDGFIDGLKQKLGQLRTIIDNITSGNFDAALDVATGSGGGGSGGSGRQTSARFGSTNNGVSLSLDGRRLDEQQGRYGRSNTARRGI